MTVFDLVLSPVRLGHSRVVKDARLGAWAAWITLLLLLPAIARAAGDFLPAEKPDAPSTIETAFTNPTTITLYWSRPATHGCTGYQVTRNGTLLNTVGADTTRLVDSSLQPGAVYHYSVAATYADRAAASSHTVTEKLPPVPQRTAHYDVVVVMASSAGVAAAVTAARKGERVALLEPTDRLGGIMSNGLCATDLRRPYHSTGFFEEFRQRVQQYYGSGAGLQYEPHVVNNVLKEMVAAEPNIDIYYHVRATGARTRGSVMLGVEAQSTDTGAPLTFLAPFTIDADPTGDVTAWAGCRCRVGREKRTKEEPHAGVIYYARALDKLLPGSTGHADHRIQAYTYLCVVKDYGTVPQQQIEPPGYKESDFIHSPAWKDSWAVTSGAMPGNKYELNQHPQGGDVQGINYRWPWESLQERTRTEKVFRDHVLGYLYYIQTHEKMPNLGLPDDEFPENGGFPETLYVREARRVVGLANLTEHDVTFAGDRLRPDAAGIGDYPMDSHAVRPKTDWTTPDMGEGEWWLYRYTPWFQVPIGVVIPADRDGLLVAEAVSATHVGYGTLRLEPVRMEMGELCGNLTAISKGTRVWPRMLPPSIVQDQLMQEGQRIFWHSDVPNNDPDGPAIQYLGAHGFWADKDFNPDRPVTRAEAWT
ncbi:MAG: FAD-dependent oxidoreductase, partial [Armatimonadota bacterium]|nr:FAD-dependent oxidoreductase [Armatimonadota bacterium]